MQPNPPQQQHTRPIRPMAPPGVSHPPPQQHQQQQQQQQGAGQWPPNSAVPQQSMKPPMMASAPLGPVQPETRPFNAPVAMRPPMPGQLPARPMQGSQSSLGSTGPIAAPRPPLSSMAQANASSMRPMQPAQFPPARPNQPNMTMPHQQQQQFQGNSTPASFAAAPQPFLTRPPMPAMNQQSHPAPAPSSNNPQRPLVPAGSMNTNAASFIKPPQHAANFAQPVGNVAQPPHMPSPGIRPPMPYQSSGSSPSAHPNPSMPNQSSSPYSSAPMPPMPGQVRPPMPQQLPPLPGGASISSTTGHQMPPMPGQPRSPMHVQQHMPPMVGQQIPSSGAPLPPMPGQSHPLMSGQSHPPMPGQSHPPMPGQQLPTPPVQQIPPQAPMSPQRQGVPPKISAAQMPNVVAVLQADLERFNDQDSQYRTSSYSDVLPPLPSTSESVTIIDDGNTSSRFMRMTCYQIPNSEEMSQSSRIPLAMVVQPFAKQHANEPVVPKVDFAAIAGSDGPIRCTRCRSFMNAFCRFVRGGRSFDCSICGMQNDVPDWYFCNLDATGRRSDVSERPELFSGAVDIVAPKEYILRQPSKPLLMFMVETTRTAVQSGALAAAIDSIRQCIKTMTDMAGNSESSASLYGGIAIATFDRVIHVFDLRGQEPSVMVMSDVTDPFVPLAGHSTVFSSTTMKDSTSSRGGTGGLFFEPHQRMSQVEAVLEMIPKMFAESRVTESCFGSAATLAEMAMEHNGGRAVMFVSSLPSLGVGILKSRDGQFTATPPSSDKVDANMLPQNDTYTKMGTNASTHGVSYILVATPATSTSLDLATIGELTRLTSGHIIHYPRFALDNGSSASVMKADVTAQLLKPFAFDVVLRMRAGSGLQTGDYLGNMCSLNQTDYQFAALNCDQSFVCTFFYDSDLSEKEPVVFQCAILHTSPMDGRRYIRVLNLAMNATSTMASVFRMADLDAYLQYSCKRAVHQISKTAIPSIMSHVHIRSAQLLGAYRKHCASNMPTGQLVLPESFKLLPLFCLALSKTVAFGQYAVSTDTRIASAYALSAMSMSELPALLYPRMYAIHAGINGSTRPQQLRLSREFINPAGIYVIDLGLKVLLWLGSQTDASLLQALFSVSSLDALNVGLYLQTASLPSLNSAPSAYLRTVIEREILARRGKQSMQLTVIRQGMDPSEIEWNNVLVEDGQAALGPSYVDFLCRLHNQINHELTSSSLAEKTALLSFLQ